MAIITKPIDVSKGTSTAFTLNKSALAAHPTVAADSFFSDISNWKEVLLVYKSSTGNQNKRLLFDCSKANPTDNFMTSIFADDVFEAEEILIKDFDGGVFPIRKSQLNQIDFIISLVATSIFGVWLFSEGDTNITFTVNANNTYMLYQAGPTEGGGHTGTELGTYTYNSGTKVFVPTVTADGNGEWGFSDGDGTMKLVPSDDNTELLVYENDELQITFTRQP